MKAISTKEFKERSKKYFDLADANERVIIQRGRKKAYLIVPLENYDDADFPEIPIEHQELVLKRLEHAKTDPEGWLDWKEAKKVVIVMSYVVRIRKEVLADRKLWLGMKHKTQD